MNDKQHRIGALLHSILRYLERRRGEVQGVDLILDKLAVMDLRPEQMGDVLPQATRHDEVLIKAIAGIKAPELSRIASCLQAAKDDLVWREDNAQFYPPSVDLGEGYTKCNLHTMLIGPDACGYTHEDFSLGIFMLGPRTLYRDHNHDAPELYLNLSEKSGWRFGTHRWQDYHAGSLIWNRSGAPHATRVYDCPFISVFVWLENIKARCNLINFDDWAEIERHLARHEQ
jgi:hypothetical protein